MFISTTNADANQRFMLMKNDAELKPTPWQSKCHFQCSISNATDIPNTQVSNFYQVVHWHTNEMNRMKIVGKDIKKILKTSTIRGNHHALPRWNKMERIWRVPFNDQWFRTVIIPTTDVISPQYMTTYSNQLSLSTTTAYDQLVKIPKGQNTSDLNH